MKDRFKNNIGLKIMAVLFAFFLWWGVVNIDDPVDKKPYNVDVTVTNPEVITNAGKSFQIVDNTRTVTVTVTARRKVLSEIKKSNIIATADLREMQDTSVPIRVTISGYEGAYEEVSANPRNIQVLIENTVKKTFPITAVAAGTPRAGYVVGNMIVEPKTVDISGPESLIQKIGKVVARVDVNELSADKDIQTTLLYYDAADNLLDQSRLTSNCDKNGVTVTVDLWKTKSLGLEFDTSGIRTASGYAFAGIEVEPQSIEVAGIDERLVEVNQISVDRSALERTNLTANEEVIVDIAKYLPEGLILADSNASSVVVRIIVDRSGTKSIQLATGSIVVLNASDRLRLEYELQAVELQFTGAKEVLDSLTAEQIVATIDLAGLEAGRHEVKVIISELPENCTYLEEVTVWITLSRKTE